VFNNYNNNKATVILKTSLTILILKWKERVLWIRLIVLTAKLEKNLYFRKKELIVFLKKWKLIFNSKTSTRIKSTINYIICYSDSLNSLKRSIFTFYYAALMTKIIYFQYSIFYSLYIFGTKLNLVGLLRPWINSCVFQSFCNTHLYVWI